ARSLLHARGRRRAAGGAALQRQQPAAALLAPRSRRAARRHRPVSLPLAPDRAETVEAAVPRLPKLSAPPLPSALRAPPPRPGEEVAKGGPLEDAKQAGITVVDWIDERTSLSSTGRWLLFRKVPRGTNWFYTLGSATLFAFLSQAVTGVFLAMYYDPSPIHAYESARYITNEVFLGQFVRGMHKWGATVMMILIFLHMGRTFFFGAYKYPRELNWVIGVVLLVLTMT